MKFKVELEFESDDIDFDKTIQKYLLEAIEKEFLENEKVKLINLTKSL
jgi:predicted transglutaminase-like protease